MLLSPGSAKAQPDSTNVQIDTTIDYYEMSLEQLISLKSHGIPSELEALINSLIAAASKKPLSSRESPSIVSLITQEEIKNSGARDLIDVLRLVPGMDFGMDVEGVVGLGIRGNWAHEGKVLILLDGQEMNEILFATNQFGNHFPIDLIKRIEIIRGPGSAIYGGFAEYGVINIITVQGADLQGVAAKATYGQMTSAMGRANGSLAGGFKKKDFELSLQGFKGSACRSDLDYTDFLGTTYNLADNSNLKPTFGNLGISWKGLSFRTMADFYQTSVRDGYDYAKPAPYREDYNSIFSELKYQWKINSKLQLTPRLSFKKQTPWKTEPDSVTEEYNKSVSRMLGNITLSYNPTRAINILAGGEYYSDIAKDFADSSYFSNDEQEITYSNYSVFFQGLVKIYIGSGDPFNFILGARYDKHNVYGDAFVPRVGITKRYNKLHFKTLYSNSFRAPSIENINLAVDGIIKPEKTAVIEAEIGYQIGRNTLITVNLFDISTKNPIVYFFDDSTQSDSYQNYLITSGTRGIEAECKTRGKWGYFSVNYSYYTANGKDRIDFYSVEDDEGALLGFANHKLTANICLHVTSYLSLNISGIMLGKRYGYTEEDTSGTSILSEFKPVFLANTYINFEPKKIPGFSMGVGVYDIANSGYAFIQPYDGYHAPMPGPSREIVFKLGYAFTKAAGKNKKEK
jgi:outer membrane cobalamin receptor